MTLERERLVALVGPSGCGKSTLARLLALWERPDRGSVWVEGLDASGLSSSALGAARRRVQLVVQDPARSVHPSFTVSAAVSEPLRVLGVESRERLRRSRQLIARVGLEESLLERPARALSGGQILRLAFARALACEPGVLILDETLAGLDLSLRSRMTELLLSLLEQSGLACLWISHDRRWVSAVADRVLTLEEGRLRQARALGPSSL